MEKIKTPLMAEIHRLEAMIEDCRDEINKGVEDATSRSILRDIIYDSGVKIKCLESLLKPERDMIEKAYGAGRKSAWDLEDPGKRKHLSKSYFTQTFESYE